MQDIIQDKQNKHSGKILIKVPLDHAAASPEPNTLACQAFHISHKWS